MEHLFIIAIPLKILAPDKEKTREQAMKFIDEIDKYDIKENMEVIPIDTPQKESYIKMLLKDKL